MTSCKRTPWFILILLTLFPWASAAATAEDIPTKWSVQSAVSYALAHNPDTRAALERIAAAEADFQLARSAFYPQVGVGLEYTRTDNPMYSFGNILNQGVFSNNMDFNDPGTTDTLQAKAIVQYRIYNGGRDQAGVDAAQNQSQASGQQNKAIRLQLEYSVVRAFCRIVQAGEVIAARQSALKAITASLAVARARYDEGSLLQEEVLNLEVQQARAQEQLIRAEHSLRLAQRGFLRLLGLKEAPVILDPQASPVQEIPGDPSIDRRAELKAMKAQIKMLEAKVRQAKGGYAPTADLVGSYQLEKGTALDEGSGNSWSAGLRLNYTLFNGGRTGAEVERAQAQLREAREQLHKLELAFNLEKEQALLSLNQEEQRLKVTQKMIRSARESARLSRLRFKEGIVLSSELIDTENRLTDALLSHSLARASRKIAIADLRRAVGLHQFFQGK
ncbi:TolC family protein [Desulfobulbus rhabdoformis]|jgi:outer membrane protein TolC|uniref:TolC family protein n=1 Tax=Desulfobulbus rhabdoformis TaxID=34032 RepID=UPI00196542EA|nr:TolC family protein [Desulfobulbus rhabdoformis]MBM9614580.1 TolC family protein [Desulfobulbus rhabdoformis]